ncbi:hypothetical protein EPN90_00805 [Patescibacteria group bacterium]|nr:MAG: hypothetical protein EPN90_00805 [Patescibacteria group bacterium]
MKDSEPTMALSVAQLVDRKTGEYHNTLRKSDIASSLPDAAIQEAKSIVADASVKAVAIIIEGQSHGGWQLSKEAVAAKIGDKIKSVADRVSDLEQSSSASSSPAAMGSAREAKSALDAAKVLVEQQDLSGALVKVIEGKELIKAAEQIASAANLEFARPTSTLSDAESAASAAIKSGMSEDTRPRIIVSSTPDIAPDLPTASSTIPVIRILD